MTEEEIMEEIDAATGYDAIEASEGAVLIAQTAIRALAQIWKGSDKPN
jgi:hypothetical protein